MPQVERKPANSIMFKTCQTLAEDFEFSGSDETV